MTKTSYSKLRKHDPEQNILIWIQSPLQRAVLVIISLSLICLATGIIIAQTTFQRTVRTTGTIVTLGVSLYWDSACTNNVTSIDWGTINPGINVDKIVYIKNDGTTAGTLAMSYGNFTPSVAATYLTISWNCSKYVLARNGVVCARFTLSVPLNITGVQDFSFNIFVQITA